MRSGGEEDGDGGIFEKVCDEKSFNEQKRGDEEFCGDSADFCGQGAAAGFLVGLDVHDFTEDVRVHGEERAEEKCLPGELGGAIEPAT